jgi:hypothetical protein
MFVLCGVYSLDEVSIYIVEAYWMGGTPPVCHPNPTNTIHPYFFYFIFKMGKRKGYPKIAISFIKIVRMRNGI